MFKNFILNEDYLKFNGWTLNDIGGYDNVKVYFKKSIENIQPNPYFNSVNSDELFKIANIEEDNMYSDQLLVQLNKPLCPIYSDCHDRDFPHSIVKEFESLDEMLKKMYTTKNLHKIR